MSHATSTSADCTPREASSENQADRYSAIPCCVVYQETIESRQLDINRPATMGRIREKDEVGAMHRPTRISRRKFQELMLAYCINGGADPLVRAGLPGPALCH